MADSLLKRVAAGDAAAMQACIDEYGGLVWSLARRHCGSTDDAEDAVQEVFISLWENAARFDESKGSEVTFVATITRRRLIDSARRTTRRRRVEEDLEQQSPRSPVAAQPAAVEQTDEAQRAAAALKRLTEAQRGVLRLAIHQGLTHEEIARATNLPLGTVKTHARRGLMKIRELLEGESLARGART